MPTYGTLYESPQFLSQELVAATKNFYSFLAAGDLTHATSQADYMNCLRNLLGMAPFVPWAGYVPRQDCQNLSPYNLQGTLPSNFPVTANNPNIIDSGPLNINPGASQNNYIGPSGGCADSFDPYCCYYPTDPACCEAFAANGECGGGGGGGGGGGTIIQNITNITNIIGEDASTVWGQITGALQTLWSVVIDSFDFAIAAAIAAIQSALTSIANALKAAFEALAHLAGSILGFLETIFKRLLSGLVKVLGRLKQLVEGLFSSVILPALQWLQKLRQWLMWLYENWIRPLLVWIQYLRQILGILKLLHIKWAQKLDQDLAELQAKITAPLFYLLSYTNALANWINLIITAGYLIQRPIWLASLNAYKGSSTALVLNSLTAPGVGLPGQGAGFTSSLPSTGQSDQAGLQYMQTQSGPYAELIGQSTSQFHQYLQAGL